MPSLEPMVVHGYYAESGSPHRRRTETGPRITGSDQVAGLR
jgi:hypothetical protein